MMNPRELLTNAPEVAPTDTWPEPLPLYRDPEAPEPFPLEALGPLEAVARETLRIVQAPEALVGASFLAAASMAVQGIANVELDGRKYPLSLYLLTIGESGERKTTVDAIAGAPLREFQETLYLKQQDEFAEWEALVESWTVEKRRILGDKRLSRRDREEALKKLGPPPPKPWFGMLLASEPTFEGLVKLLADGWPAAGLFSSEGGSGPSPHAWGLRSSPVNSSPFLRGPSPHAWGLHAARSAATPPPRSIPTCVGTTGLHRHLFSGHLLGPSPRAWGLRRGPGPHRERERQGKVKPPGI